MRSKIQTPGQEKKPFRPAIRILDVVIVILCVILLGAVGGKQQRLQGPFFSVCIGERRLLSLG